MSKIKSEYSEQKSGKLALPWQKETRCTSTPDIKFTSILFSRQENKSISRNYESQWLWKHRISKHSLNIASSISLEEKGIYFLSSIKTHVHNNKTLTNVLENVYFTKNVSFQDGNIYKAFLERKGTKRPSAGLFHNIIESSKPLILKKYVHTILR